MIVVFDAVNFTTSAVIWSLVRVATVRQFLVSVFMMMIDLIPDKSPEPIAIGIYHSAVAVPVASRRWLSFCR